MELPHFSGYETTALLDQGPTREVYAAIEVTTGRAVKIVALAVGLNPESPYRALIATEARALKRLDHPAFPKIVAEGSGKESWFAYWTPRGRALSEERRRLEPSQIRGITAQLAAALAHAHDHDVIHGQLTTADVLVTETGAVCIENCGRSADLEETFAPLPRRRLGSSAPEDLVGESAGAAGDVFALGVILYELLSGTEPFGPPGDKEYARRVRREAPPKLDSKLPRDLTKLCFQLLEKSPLARPNDLAKVARQLQGETHEVSSPFGTARRFGALALLAGLFVSVLGFGYLLGRRAATEGHSLAGFGSKTALGQDEARPLRDEAMLLRVVATPWAHVYVDGIQRETTPFAEPIRLEPGRHEIKLVHPNAPTEIRSIDGTTGQLVFLDVAMHISALPTALETQEAEKDSTP